LLSSLFVVFFLPGLCAADSVEHSADAAGEDGAGTTPSQQVRSGKVRIGLDALELNIYGLSYHPDREAVGRRNLDNEFNPGLGLHYELSDSARGVSFAEVGAYYDSGRNWAKFAGLGYQFKLGEHWRAGGSIALMHSKTYNDSTGFVAVIPLITYDFGNVKLNAAYYPKFAHYNDIAAFGVYLSIPLGQWAR
jgi:hypothetical protein